MNNKRKLIELYDCEERYSIFSNKYKLITRNDFKNQLISNDGLELETNTIDTDITINGEMNVMAHYIQNPWDEDCETYIVDYMKVENYWKVVKHINVYDGISVEVYGYGSIRDVALNNCDALIEALIEVYPSEI